VGSVWLRNVDQTSFTSRTVAIVPGGVAGDASFNDITSCVDLMEMMLSGASLHVIDVETGKLMRKFYFSDSPDIADLETELQHFYDTLDSAGNTYTTMDNPIKYNGGADGDGWDCYEKRLDKYDPLTVPPELASEEGHPDTNCEVIVDVPPIDYRISCCNNSSGNCVPGGGLTPCHYRYTRYDSGRIEVFIKTEGCPDSTGITVADGRFELKVSENFMMDGVSATLVAYDTSLGNFIDRVFVPTKRGKIFRINLANGQYDPDAGEGEMVTAFPQDAQKNWRLDPPDRPWFDPFEPTAGPLKDEPRRPISVSPASALNYRRNLVLFAGTGDIENLASNSDVDYFMAIEEKREADSEHYYNPTEDGVLFEKDGALMNNPMEFPTGERLFSRPLIVAGKVVFSTYVAPEDTECDLGTGKIYAMPFDDFRPEERIVEQEVDTVIESPAVVWLPSGKFKVGVQKGDEVELVDLGEAEESAARVLSWSKVL